MLFLREINEFFKTKFCNHTKEAQDSLWKILGYHISGASWLHFVNKDVFDMMTNEEKLQFSQIKPEYEKTINQKTD
jgi:hypothetical protein